MRFFAKKKAPRDDELLKELEKTKLAIDTAYSNFENVIEPELIDSYIYELNAAQERYKYLLRQAKALDRQLTVS